MADESVASDLRSRENLSWYAVQTRPRHEKRVAEQLRGTSLEAFLPLHRAVHKWNNGVRAEVDLPLFPGYLFARACDRERVQVLRLPGVLGFASSANRPIPVEDCEIHALRTAIEKFKAEPHPFLNTGDRVRVVAGPLAGMEGILIRRRQELRLVLSIELIMRSIIVEVSGLDIEPMPHQWRA
jgi:transcription antitermination factor NusG